MRPTRRTLQPRRSPQGFTLMELLIVLSIIGIMAALALPQMQAFSWRARRVEREAIRKGIMSALQVHAREHQGQVVTLNLPQNPTTDATRGLDNFQPKLGDWDAVGFAPEGRVRYRYSGVYKLDTTTTTVVLTIQGDADADGQLSQLDLEYKLEDGAWMLINEAATLDDW